MNTKNKITQIIYLGLAVSFIILCIVFYKSEKGMMFLSYFLMVLLLPIFDSLIEYIKFEQTKTSFHFSSYNIFKLILFLLIVIYILATKSLNIFEYTIFFTLIFGILFPVDERYYFTFSLIFLIFVICFLLTENKKLAENFSIYVYYLLVTGVIISITNSSLNKNIEKKENTYIQNLIKSKTYTKIKKHKIQKIIDVSLILYAIGIVICLGIGAYDFIKYISIFMVTLYIIAKCFGYTCFKNVKN